jgi:hypothetical protein
MLLVLALLSSRTKMLFLPYFAGSRAQRDEPSCVGASVFARLLRTMAFGREPPLPHYVGGDGQLRDA